MNNFSQRHARINFVWLVALALLAVAFVVRVYRLGEPPTDFHATRQFIGAIVARDFYCGLGADVPEAGRQLAHFTKQHQELLEPQILPAISAAGYKITGGERLWIPRLVSILCWLGGGVFLFGIALKYFPPRAALVSLAFYLLMPYAIVATRVIQPDPMMVGLMLAALFLMLRYDAAPTWRNLLPVIAMSAAAMFVRPMCVFFLDGAFVALQWSRRGLGRGIFNWQSVVFGAASLAPAAAFYIYGTLSGGFIREQGSFSFMPHLLLQREFWTGWLTMVGRVTGWLPGLMALAGGLALARGQFRVLLAGLWAGYFGYGLVFNYHIHTHDYYSLPLLPVAALSLAPVGGALFVWIEKLRAKKGMFVGLIAAALVVCMVAVLAAKKLNLKTASPGAKAAIKNLGAVVGFDKKALVFVRRSPKEARAEIEDFKKIGALVGHSERTIFLDEVYGKTLMYYGGLCGVNWPTSTDILSAHRTGRPMLESAADFAALARRNAADYFIVTTPGDLELQPAVRDWLLAHSSVVERNERFAVFKLASD